LEESLRQVKEEVKERLVASSNLSFKLESPRAQLQIPDSLSRVEISRNELLKKTHSLPIMEVEELPNKVEILSLQPRNYDVPAPLSKPSNLQGRVVSDSKSAPVSNSSVSVDKVRTILEKHPLSKKVPLDLSMAIIKAESNFQSGAISKDGHFSKGLFQLLDETGNERLQEVMPGMDYLPFNPAMNITLGLEHLSYLKELFTKDSNLGKGKLKTLAVAPESLTSVIAAAFNAGQGRVARAQALVNATGGDPRDYTSLKPYLPKTTIEYVSRVLQFQKELKLF
jgi:hypothetical protein